MSESSVNIRPAQSSELPVIAGLLNDRLLSLALPPTRAAALQAINIEKHLGRLLPDRALLVAPVNRQLAGLAALDLDRGEMLALYLDRELGKRRLAERLIGAAEKRALDFALRRLRVRVSESTEGFFRQLGYAGDAATDGQGTVLEKSLLPQAPEWYRERMELLDELGIPANYGVRHRLTLRPEATELVSIGNDIYGRDQRLIPAAARAWQAMREAANQRGVELDVISGFRKVTYQAGIVRRKQEAGQRLDQILSVSAAPGFSEHHTGRALDLSTKGSQPLEESFAATEAYHWLKSNAGVFGFRESYPRNNRHGILWEPWHWCYVRN